MVILVYRKEVDKLNLLSLIIQNANEDLKDQLKTIHPRQLTCNDEISFEFYKVSYQYDTIRGNHRDNAEKIMIKQMPINHNPRQTSDSSMKLYKESNVKNEFMKFIKKFNKENPIRPLLNVEILSVSLLGESRII